MPEKLTSKKVIVIITISVLLFAFVSLAGVAYALFLRPEYGDRYANIFFMISFILIIASLILLYHVWVERNDREED